MHYAFTSNAGVKYFTRPEADGSTTWIGTQDVEPVLEQNKAERSHNDGYTPSRDMRRVARVPFQVMNQWKAEEGWDPYDLSDPDNARRMAAKLNSNEWMHLRTADGRVGVVQGVLK